MTKVEIAALEGRRYPAGRRTRSFAGHGLALPAEGFGMGVVELDPGGGQVPWHDHPNEEVYLVLEGELELALGGELGVVRAGEAVHIPPNTFHQLTNRGDAPARFVYVYAPGGDVAHWRQELEGTLPRAGEGAPPLPDGAAGQRA